MKQGRGASVAGLTVLGLLLVVGGVIVYRAYEQGRERYFYTVQRFDKFVPVPHLYDNYTGWAEPIDGDRIKVYWQHREVHAAPSRNYFEAIGRIDVGAAARSDGARWYYVLAMDDRLYLEKSELIDSYIFALCALTRGKDPENHPPEILEAVACLPDDPARLTVLVQRFH